MGSRRVRTSVPGQHVRERHPVVRSNGFEVPLHVPARPRRHRRGRIIARGPQLVRLLRGARGKGQGHRRWLGETRALDHRRVGDSRAVDRRRVARGCPRGAVPVVQRVELDADAGHGRQQPARIVPRKSMTERHSTAASRISGAARGPFAAAAEERALRPDLLLHLRRARGRPDDARTRGSRASRVRHPAPSVELLNRSRGGGLDFRPSRERLWAQRVEKRG